MRSGSLRKFISQTVEESQTRTARLIYVDDDSFPGAIRVTGTYSVEGEIVRVRGFLRKDGGTIASLP